MVEHGTENAGVDSSILSLGTSADIPLYFVAKNSDWSPSDSRLADVHIAGTNSLPYMGQMLRLSNQRHSLTSSTKTSIWHMLT